MTIPPVCTKVLSGWREAWCETRRVWRQWGWLIQLAINLTVVGGTMLALYLVVSFADLRFGQPKIGISPSSPIDTQLADVVCNAEKVTKFHNLQSGTWGYKAIHNTSEGSSVVVSWTDALGIDDKASVQVDGGTPMLFDMDKRTANCFYKRAVPAPGSLE